MTMLDIEEVAAPPPPAVASKLDPSAPVRVQGKFFFVGDKKHFVKGVTYGPFPKASHGAQFPECPVVDTDFALMAEAVLSRISSGMIKTAVPLYALLVFGLDITSVMGLVLIQNIVPLLLRSFFGTLADKYGKKPVFMISLSIRTVVGLLYAVANLPFLFAVSLVRGIADSAKGLGIIQPLLEAARQRRIRGDDAAPLALMSHPGRQQV